MTQSDFDTKFENYINQKKELYDFLLEYIENEEEDDYIFQNFIKYVEDSELLKDHEETKLLLRLILQISKYHYRTANFCGKIERILSQYQKEIKQTFSNLEIFEIFKNNKRILLFLLEKEIIKTDEEIIQKLIKKVDKNGTKYCHFFYPEIESFWKETNPSKVESIKQEIIEIDPNIFLNFEAKRKLGENENYLCSLIRDDIIDDFISHVTRSNMKLTSKIKVSIFETNSYLIQHETTLIEYAAFYGSIQIFQYLKISGVSLTPVLWFYVIHGNNAEMFHLLEENHVSTIFHGSYSKCLQAAIQFHNKNVVNYVIDNVIKDVDLSQEEFNTYDENRLNYCFHYINFAYFPTQNDNSFILFYLCQYDYYNLVTIFVENEKVDLNETISAISSLYILSLFYSSFF
ncbi:hypothetical protein M9Y10_037935 [Tritrichomonas musculus]|uniref:DUF3447 domain-containing protein n=1 Tax=Tritrichomonas musculus TaxID=1915356 RepID=A0ABR2K7K7_9EUKA